MAELLYKVESELLQGRGEWRCFWRWGRGCWSWRRPASWFGRHGRWIWRRKSTGGVKLRDLDVEEQSDGGVKLHDPVALAVRKEKAAHGGAVAVGVVHAIAVSGGLADGGDGPGGAVQDDKEEAGSAVHNGKEEAAGAVQNDKQSLYFSFKLDRSIILDGIFQHRLDMRIILDGLF